MLLRLSLPEGKVVWALAHPISKGYIHQQSGVGYQECQLIVTEQDQPVDVELDDLPKWAQVQVRTSVFRNELINTGEPLKPKTKPKEKEIEGAKSDTATMVEKPKIKKKRQTKRSKKLKNE